VLFLIDLADFDQKKLGIELGYPSTLACLVGELGLTESSACRRLTAARLLARFPKIAEYLLSRRLSMASLLALREILDEENHADVLERAAGMSESEVRELVSRITRARSPERELPLVATAPAVGAVATPMATSDVASTPALVTDSAAEEKERPVAITLWVGKDFRDELARVRDLASHVVPSGKVEEVLLHVLSAYRKQKERRRFGGAEPQARPTAKPPRQGDRYVPAAVRREVYDRERGTCAYVGPEGRRCDSTWQLEVQHVVPFARGGQSTPRGLTLFCRSHNLLLAEKDFGAAHVAARIQERRERSQVAKDVRAALKNLGYGSRQAEQAVVQALATVPPRNDFQALLREALRVLGQSSTVVPM
ncbi:MAG: hypothetical protein HY698_09925, partial [Deltaproteobacteria bacterium]|nr:hypothetical protein [Deltaproteobacteria bacterium]